MIEIKYLRSLKIFEGKKGAVYYHVVMLIPIFTFVMAILNIITATKIGLKEGCDILCLMKEWISGIDVNSQYSGLYLKALERLKTAVTLFGGTLVFSIIAIKSRIARQRNRRIIEILQSHKEWPGRRINGSRPKAIN